jgi:transposase
MINEASEQENLQEKCARLESKISELELLIKWYEERLRLNAVKQYGSSSEQSAGEQLGFFDEAEATADKKAGEPVLDGITYKRGKRAGKREEDFSSLPVETVTHELPVSEQVCKECGEPLHVMGKEVRKELTIVPARVKVTEHIRYVYSCRNCEETGVTVPVIRASMPEPVIKGSPASPSAIAHIMTQKYVTCTPLYRQEQEFLNKGVPLSRQTMANWVVKASADWLEPVYERLKRELLSNGVLHADETTVQVLREPGRKANTESYMWLYRTGGDTLKPVVLYDYRETRSSSHPKRFLSGWTGYLHTDGYSGYHSLPNVTVAGCWAHMRRKFDEALKSMTPEESQNSAARAGLDFCNRLFALEREFEGLDPKERFKRRLESSKPIADAFFAWAAGLNVLPKFLLGKAVRYALDQRPYLLNFYLDGRLELSNNRAERSIKPFVMGRKNWLFSNTPNGARASSVVYSVIQSALDNGLIPFEYLKLLFEALPNITTSQLDSFLPWSPSIPPYCKSPK